MVEPILSTPAAEDSRTDAQLVEQLPRQGNSAMRTLLRRHQAAVWRLAWRLTGDAATADDLTQEAFLRLYQMAARYRPEAALSTFLHRIVVNLVIDARRTRRSHLRLQDAPEPPAADGKPDPLVAAERARRVQQAIQALPERQRVALVLHRYEGQSYKQIAEVTQDSAAAVESLLMRAYARLRQELADLGEA
jgi:RNA polymerase sigma-70 factor, ECF subfamily